MSLPLQIIFNEGWGQVRSPPWPEQELTDVVRSIDPSRLVNSVSGWNDHGFGDFSVSILFMKLLCILIC
jgi:hypothetical protein